MYSKHRRSMYSGKQFVCALAVAMAGLYGYALIASNANRHAPGHESGTPQEAYVADPYNYGTPVSPVWEKSRRAIETARTARVAAREGKIPDLQKILQQGMRVDSDLGMRRTLLMVACENGRIETARFLVGRHANIRAMDIEGRTPLSIAADNGHIAIVDLLLDADKNARIAEGPGAHTGASESSGAKAILSASAALPQAGTAPAVIPPSAIKAEAL